jgi:hypothetical protein
VLADEKASQERAVREAALDRTIEDSFPASDPPSSIPDPYDPTIDPQAVARTQLSMNQSLARMTMAAAGDENMVDQ